VRSADRFIENLGYYRNNQPLRNRIDLSRGY
jgi:hypothetical protein